MPAPATEDGEVLVQSRPLTPAPRRRWDRGAAREVQAQLATLPTEGDRAVDDSLDGPVEDAPSSKMPDKAASKPTRRQHPSDSTVAALVCPRFSPHAFVPPNHDLAIVQRWRASGPTCRVNAGRQGGAN